jgi:putative oligomerization/nucleic acid binding protein
MTEANKSSETGQARAASCFCGPFHCGQESVRAVLDRRYANGELTKEQYESMKRDLKQA